MKRLRKLFKHRWLVVGMILLFLVGVSRLPLLGRSSQKQSQYTVVRQDLQKTLTLSGKVDADEKALLHFQTSGKLVWLGVKEGDTVGAYQGIASLDKVEIQKKLEKTLNSYLKTRWDFEQLHDDYEGKILTDTIKRILEKSQFDLNNSVLDVEIQNEAVQLATLTSPIHGVVTHVAPAVPGVNVTPLTAEIEVVNPNSIYLSVTADQTEVTNLSPNMKTEIVFDSYPSEHIEGTVTSIGFSPKPDETSVVYEVKVKLAITNEAYRYRLGMTADASFVTQEKEGVLGIPTNFLKEEKGQTFVMKRIKGKAEKTQVSVGLETDSEVEITSGISEGDVLYD